MKSTLIVFIASFLQFVTAASQNQWEIANKGIEYDLKSVDFISGDVGWIAGENGVFKTTDGAENWELICTKTKLHEIDFLNDSIGWASARWGELCDSVEIYCQYWIIKTLDGGQTWIPQRKVHGLYDLTVVSELVVYAIGDSILKTMDRGSNWENVTPVDGPLFSSACFQNADTGVVVGHKNTIFRTSDGGETWKTRSIPEFSEISNVRFIDSSAISFLASIDSGPYFICKTIDTFQTWSVLFENKYPIHWCHYYDKNVIISLADTMETLQNGLNINLNFLKSTDGGSTWMQTEHMQLDNSWTYKLHATEKTTYMFAQNRLPSRLPQNRLSWRLLLESTDQGNHWQIEGMTIPFTDVHFVNREKGLIVGGQPAIHYAWGAILKTEDRGKTWDIECIPNSGPTGMHFLNESKGFINFRNGTNVPGFSGVYSTLDGGDHWQPDTMFSRINDVRMINDTVGWLAASNHWLDLYIFHTVNGGQTWETILDPCGIGVCALSFCFVDESTGFGIGYEGSILRFSENGEWELIESGTTLPLNNIFFVNRDHGIITGGYYSFDEGYMSIMLKTEDGGNSWMEIPDIPYLIHDIHFTDSLHGVAVGENFEAGCGGGTTSFDAGRSGCGVILETEDGGNHWNEMMDGLSGPLRALHVKDGTSWAVGDKGLMLVKYDSIYTLIPEFSITPEDGHFYNYPNPFHSKTMISYHLPETCDVELSIYDLSGRKVATFLNESHAAGKHEVEWNASGRQPGIYFCELKTALVRQVIKMILIQ